jgi:hypothetical protein
MLSGIQKKIGSAPQSKNRRSNKKTFLSSLFFLNMSMNESYTNEWTPRAHRLINEWKEKAQGYAWMHTQSSKIF